MKQFTVCKDHADNPIDVREAFRGALNKLAENDKRIMMLEADLSAAVGTSEFGEKFPGRLVNCGIQEANMIGVACGLSIQGKIPFTHTFGPFCTRRAFDQIFLSGAYNKANVKVIGSDPGILASYNGGTHMPFEDMGTMCLIPQMTVVEPTDSVMTAEIIRMAAEQYGMFYIRLIRDVAPAIYEAGSKFTLGKANELREGKDVTIIASGYCVNEALAAAETLAGEGIDAKVLDMFTWKPLDEEAVLTSAEKTGAIVTAENHNIVNGLGAAVAAVLARKRPTPVEMVGVKDEFGEVGPVSYLRERFGLTREEICAATKRAVARKA